MEQLKILFHKMLELMKMETNKQIKKLKKAIQCFLGQPSLDFSECNIGDIVIVTNPQ